MSYRVGTGFDIHRLVEGRPLWLGGVRIPHDKGLLGHSDGDALLHAAADALLGAAGLGDLGRLFPDSDPHYAGADSRDLLKEVVRRVREAGWEPVNLDSTLIAERPRLAPHIEAMRTGLSGILGLPPEAVSVKAKTHEGLDSLGRGEAIAAQAVVLIKER
jgi:2-C-methyl-D-erythritol 2,4-cyclodiphosphate synthase